MNTPPRAVFLSYASQDADAARRICDVLRAAGLEVWFDQSELRGGDSWDASIRKQIKECALFVPMISASTNARSEGYFRLEWKLAVDRSHLIADDQPFLMPLILGDTPESATRVPDRFRERQWSRLNSDESIRAFAARLASLLSVAPPTSIESPAAVVQVPPPLREKPTPGPSPNPDDVTKAAARPAPTLITAPMVSRRKPVVMAAILFAVLAVLIAGGWYYIDRNRKAVFVAEAIPRIEALADRQKFVEAFQLAREAEQAGAGEALTKARRDAFSREVNVQSEPEGASISFRLYGTEAWQEVGRAPLTKMRIPRAFLEWRAALPGHKPAGVSLFAQPDHKLQFTLLAEKSPDADMVSVSAGVVRLRNTYGLKTEDKIPLPRFLIDRTEVSNREFLRFVKAGGYTKPEYWKHAFRDGQRTLTFEAAMQRFRDATGRGGPATWKLGSHPDGEEDMPVRGISWHEASAYAVFAGKELPTLYHWYWADSANDMVGYLPSVTLPLSNFESLGPRKVAEGKAIGAFGAINMAGNVREWLASTTNKGDHLAAGGAWHEPDYSYLRVEQRGAFDRPLDTGVRCMKRQGSEPIPPVALAVLPTVPPVNASQMKPVLDAEFAIYKRLYERRRVLPEGKIEASDTSSPHWIRQKVSYAAGYGGERLWAYLYQPKSAKPPYQTVIHMGGSGSFTKRNFVTDADYPGFQVVDLLVRGGRAVIIPIWKGSFERHAGFDAEDESQLKEHMSLWVTELRQTVEFIRSREDLDKDRIGYQGSSFGAMWAPIFLAMEPQIRTGILIIGGISVETALSPEINPVNFAPRVIAPVLMLNGRSDPIFPYETSQVPLFKMFGTPATQKRHQTFATGHSFYGWYEDMVREHHDWLDKVFGAVTPSITK